MYLGRKIKSVSKITPTNKRKTLFAFTPTLRTGYKIEIDTVWINGEELPASDFYLPAIFLDRVKKKKKKILLKWRKDFLYIKIRPPSRVIH